MDYDMFKEDWDEYAEMHADIPDDFTDLDGVCLGSEEVSHLWDCVADDNTCCGAHPYGSFFLNELLNYIDLESTDGWVDKPEIFKLYIEIFRLGVRGPGRKWPEEEFLNALLECKEDLLLTCYDCCQNVADDRDLQIDIYPDADPDLHLCARCAEIRMEQKETKQKGFKDPRRYFRDSEGNIDGM